MVFKKALLTLALSVMLSSGSGVFAAHPDNGLTATQYKAALAVLIPLAEQGDVDAQLTLGIMYAKGLGVLENDRTAVKWYTLAAEQGHAKSQYNLGIMYFEGAGVLTDNRRAYMWVNLSTYNSNDKNGPKAKNIISKKMTPADISKAQDMSSRCLESGYTDC